MTTSVMRRTKPLDATSSVPNFYAHDVHPEPSPSNVRHYASNFGQNDIYATDTSVDSLSDNSDTVAPVTSYVKQYQVAKVAAAASSSSSTHVSTQNDKSFHNLSLNTQQNSLLPTAPAEDFSTPKPLETNSNVLHNDITEHISEQQQEQEETNKEEEVVVEEEDEPVRLFVGQVPESMIEGQLKALFATIMVEVLDVAIIRDKHTGRHRHCAFITVPSRQQATVAVDQFHNKKYLESMSNPMQVKEANQPKPRGAYAAANVAAFYSSPTAAAAAAAAFNMSYNTYIQNLTGFSNYMTIQQQQQQMSNMQKFFNPLTPMSNIAQLSQMNSTALNNMQPYLKPNIISPTYQSMNNMNTVMYPYLTANTPINSKSSNNIVTFPITPTANNAVYNNTFAYQLSTPRSEAIGFDNSLTQQNMASFSYQMPQVEYSQQMNNITSAETQAQPMTHDNIHSNLVNTETVQNNQRTSSIAHSQMSNAGAETEQLNTDNTNSYSVNNSNNNISNSSPADMYSNMYKSKMSQSCNNNQSGDNNNNNNNIAQYNNMLNQLQNMNIVSNMNTGLSEIRKSSTYLEGPMGANLFVNNLPDDFADDNLFELFSSHGSILSYKVFIDKYTHKSKGFGFVSFSNISEATEAIRSKNGFEVAKDRRIIVEIKRSKRKYPLDFF